MPRGRSRGVSAPKQVRNYKSRYGYDESEDPDFPDMEVDTGVRVGMDGTYRAYRKQKMNKGKIANTKKTTIKRKVKK